MEIEIGEGESKDIEESLTKSEDFQVERDTERQIRGNFSHIHVC